MRFDNTIHWSKPVRQFLCNYKHAPLRLSQVKNDGWQSKKVYSDIGHWYQISSLRIPILVRCKTTKGAVRVVCALLRIWPLMAQWPITLWDGVESLKGSQRLWEGRIFLNNLRVSLFNDDLSIESNSGQIHLAGQYLQWVSFLSFLNRCQNEIFSRIIWVTVPFVFPLSSQGRRPLSPPYARCQHHLHTSHSLIDWGMIHWLVHLALLLMGCFVKFVAHKVWRRYRYSKLLGIDVAQLWYVA
jgi:hypothetical protein